VSIVRKVLHLVRQCQATLPDGSPRRAIGRVPHLQEDVQGGCQPAAAFENPARNLPEHDERRALSPAASQLIEDLCFLFICDILLNFLKTFRGGIL